LAVVASPAPFHAKHSLPLIEAGIPALIEKPVAVTEGDADTIFQATQLHGTPVAIGYCLRYLPSVIKLKELIEQRCIGQIY
ncbi:Gfo/Idh/MocA family oxidoreductase, partial [Paraburkholderia sp. SIMBA_053]|uniref:Gfo/Idh/MocA family oxidoreductase n=1 Tax=Paraburkholderia sp. SIMBA_053 TaxID=3085794 RepID=UPI00397DB098